MKPPPLPGAHQTHAGLRKELCIFFIGLGVLLAIPAYFALSGISGNPPPLWGLPRHLAIGVPVAILSALHLFSGTLLAVLDRRLFGVAGAISSTLITIFYAVFMYAATGDIPTNLISIVIAAIPFVVWSRVSKFLSTTSSLK